MIPMRHRLAHATCLASAVLVVACNQDLPVTSPSPGSISKRGALNFAQAGRRIVTPSQALAQQIPEFGGAFIDNTGTLNIYITDDAAIPAASAAVNNQLRALGRSAMPLRFIRAQYSFRTLQSYADALGPTLVQVGIVYVWIDEWTNRLRLGIVNFSTGQQVIRVAMAQLGIPDSAVIIEAAAPPAVATVRQLTDGVSPLIGGLKVTAEGYDGTLGAIVRWANTTYALVSSHLVSHSGNGALGVHVLQAGRDIGVVTVNPATTSVGCGVYSPCRRSDAALARVDTAIHNYAHLARPIGGIVTGGSAGPIAFDDADLITLTFEGTTCQHFSGCIIQFYPGDSASKVGMTSGWTGGRYLGLSEASPGHNHTYYHLETMIVEGHAQGGDSGGPILAKPNNRISGIVWAVDTTAGANRFYGSVWPNISADLTGSEFRLHNARGGMLGWQARWIHPPACPDNPDAWDMYLLYGNPNGDGTFDVTNTIYMGNTWYFCAGEIVNGNYQQSPAFQSCLNQFGNDCPCADYTAGGSSCPVREP